MSRKSASARLRRASCRSLSSLARFATYSAKVCLARPAGTAAKVSRHAAAASEKVASAPTPLSRNAARSSSLVVVEGCSCLFFCLFAASPFILDDESGGGGGGGAGPVFFFPPFPPPFMARVKASRASLRRWNAAASSPPCSLSLPPRLRSGCASRAFRLKARATAASSRQPASSPRAAPAASRRRFAPLRSSARDTSRYAAARSSSWRLSAPWPKDGATDPTRSRPRATADPSPADARRICSST
mmetsp:Transcript_9436/g.30799  ORF Transcript_9436/g.30799 Transcript_9436/m.30799 type:complete len:245 (-) Transcript_9436:56-790(-)